MKLTFFRRDFVPFSAPPSEACAGRSFADPEQASGLLSLVKLVLASYFCD
jgi:hypothetical protein